MAQTAKPIKRANPPQKCSAAGFANTETSETPYFKRFLGIEKVHQQFYQNYGGLLCGAEGNRTLSENRTEAQFVIYIPLPKQQTLSSVGSFMMHGAGKAYRTHGLHSNHTRARLVDLPGRMGA